ncbi:MAG: hypothetical protein HY298_26525 [Verrucomicrobia bacterium]|nr:hypothetical protein [Verrucomicrobiota bacterium]
MKQTVTSSVLIVETLLLALLSGGCAFSRAWNAAATTATPTADIQGRWRGTWASEVSAHTGKLRCIITKQDDGKYQARYHANYRKILSFSYTVTLDATYTNGIYKFSGDADLGWAGGVYHYAGQANTTNFYSTYQSRNDHGIFQMRRPE